MPLRDSQDVQLPAQPLEQRQNRQALRVLRIVIPCVLGLFLLSVEVIGLFTQLGWLPFSPPPGGKVRAPEAQQMVTVATSRLLDGVVHHFMDAMLQKNWRVMWSLLHPDARQSWQGEQDFLHVEQAKFAALTLQSYRLSPPRIVSSWRDPDTTKVYPYAATLTVSLAAAAPEGLLSLPSRFALAHGLFEHTLLALIQNRGPWQVLVAGPADLEAPLLVPATPPARKLVVPIFMYHHVSRRPARDLLDYNLTVTTNDFAQQLTWLQQNGYHSISETDLFNALYYGKVLPAHPMMLTFDDGYEDMYTDALPVILQHQDRGIFYIITGMIGRDYMTWEQIQTLAHDGMQIASHTVHHINIGQPPAGTSTQAELLVSKQTLEAQLDQPVQFFCYPVGEPFHHDSLLEQRLVLADLFNDGYVGATLDPFSIFSAVQNGLMPYQLQRIRVSGGESLEEFSGILQATLSNARSLKPQ
jgi:peptidoglycan/xylan/chitin deacetylase (PgdA/CDA1 family)